MNSPSSFNNQIEYVMREGAIYRRTIENQFMGFQDEILDGLIEPPPVFIRNLHQFNQQPVHGLFGGNDATRWAVIISQLPSLPIRIHMHLSPDGKSLGPVTAADFLNGPGSKGTVTIRDAWVPPQWARLFLFVRLILSGGPEPRLVYENTYLFLKTGTGQFLTPHYPNLHDNGRVCMGHALLQETRILNEKKTPVLDYFIRAHTSFHTSSNNGDLVRAETLNLFKRSVDIDGEHRWILPAEENPANAAKLGGSASTAWMPHLKEL